MPLVLPLRYRYLISIGHLLAVISENQATEKKLFPKIFSINLSRRIASITMPTATAVFGWPLFFGLLLSGFHTRPSIVHLSQPHKIGTPDTLEIFDWKHVSIWSKLLELVAFRVPHCTDPFTEPNSLQYSDGNLPQKLWTSFTILKAIPLKQYGYPSKTISPILPHTQQCIDGVPLQYWTSNTVLNSIPQEFW